MSDQRGLPDVDRIVKLTQDEMRHVCPCDPRHAPQLQVFTDSVIPSQGPVSEVRRLHKRPIEIATPYELLASHLVSVDIPQQQTHHHSREQRDIPDAVPYTQGGSEDEAANALRLHGKKDGWDAPLDQTVRLQRHASTERANNCVLTPDSLGEHRLVVR